MTGLRLGAQGRVHGIDRHFIASILPPPIAVSGCHGGGPVCSGFIHVCLCGSSMI